MDKSSNTERLVERPDPDNLIAFLPWACGQLQVPKDVIITKNLQKEYVSAAVSDRGKSKIIGKSKPRLPSIVDMDDQGKEEASASQEDEDTVRINGVYDYADNLVGLKFYKNTSIPRMLMQILGLIIKFQIYLTSITINQGLNQYVLYELVNFLPSSKITEICLDNCFFSQGSYYILLERASHLRNLSLARCRINDDVVALIAAQLCHPKPGSAMLIILNLSSNRITDVGVKSISDALKTNSKLNYLNLADNMITDDGAASIFNILLEFPLTEQELKEMRSRHIIHLRNKHAEILRMAQELRVTDMMKSKKVTMTKPLKTKGKSEKDESSLTAEKSVVYSEAAYYEKAQALAEASLTPFKDPYSLENVTSRDGLTYCLGNNTLTLLNLSYNNLSYPSVQKLLEVILYQRDQNRNPRGLLNCRIEGNPLPLGCKELTQIEEVLEYNISGPIKRNAVSLKKKGSPKCEDRTAAGRENRSGEYANWVFMDVHNGALSCKVWGFIDIDVWSN